MSDVERRTALVEANFAAVAGQLGAGHDGSRLELDAREILGATARLVGAQLGDIETDTSIALTQLYVEQGTRDDYKVVGTKKSLARLIYGTERIGGKNVAQIHKALVSLFRMELQFRGYDAAARHSKMIYARLLTRLVFDEQINLLRDDPSRYDPSIMGRRWKGTVEVSLDEWFASQIRAGYWVSLDWEKLRALGGTAKTLWLLLSSPRVPFLPAADDGAMEQLGVPLDAEAYRALGINRGRERDSRRALEQAGQRILRVDPAYTAFDIIDELAAPGCKRLVVTRRRSSVQLGPAAADAQLQLAGVG